MVLRVKALTASAPRLLHLSLVSGGDLVDQAGAKLGRVDDVIVRLGEDEYPPVTGLLVTVAGRQVFVPADEVEEIEHGRVKLRAPRLDLQPFGRRPQEVLLKKDVLDRQLINLEGARLVRANEIELARLDGWYRVVGVDVGLRGLVRRILPQALADSIGTSDFLDWASLEPFTGHLPTVRLRVPHPKLARLHPAQLADLVEAASHGEGRRSSRRLVRIPSWRRTCSRNWSHTTSSSFSRSARTIRSPSCSRAWRPTTPPISWQSCRRSGARASSSYFLPSSAAVFARFLGTTPPRRAG